MKYFCMSVLFGSCVISALPALAANDWQKPTSEELSMTSQPEVPGADAVYLFREEITEDREGSNSDTMDMGGDRLNYRSVYVRLKVLTEAGKKYSDVRVTYDPRTFAMGAVAGRTIHRDGSVVPFSGKPFVRVVEKSKPGE